MNRGEQKNGFTVYLMRHGDSRQDEIRRFIGRTDHPLNETGRAQAEAWERKLAHIRFGTICCSNLLRSIETARIIGLRQRGTLTILPDLGEINLGSWDGMSISDVRQLFPLEYERRGSDLIGYRPPDGESFTDLSARVLPAFENAISQAGKNMLIVGHAGVNRTILCHLLGMPLANLFRLEQEYGCLNILEFAVGAWVVRRMNIPA
ncbi:MAG: histidine phosphatase family protein [Desulfuromonadaceae bacterium]|nr:histidine phosphatase family protein [Desulfuromonadaceae bacterium]MDD5105004.1 histidine phosphatase family protein [Desulfuromonadaceae bacterium]